MLWFVGKNLQLSFVLLKFMFEITLVRVLSEKTLYDNLDNLVLPRQIQLTNLHSMFVDFKYT